MLAQKRLLIISFNFDYSAYIFSSASHKKSNSDNPLGTTEQYISHIDLCLGSTSLGSSNETAASWTIICFQESELK